MPKSENYLVEKAKQRKISKPVDKALQNLVLAYLKNEITITQVSHALGKKSGCGAVQSIIIKAVRHMFETGVIGQIKK